MYIFLLTVHLIEFKDRNDWRGKITFYSRYYSILRGIPAACILFMLAIIPLHLYWNLYRILVDQGRPSSSTDYHFYKRTKIYAKYRYVPFAILCLFFLYPSFHVLIYNRLNQL